MKTKKRPSKSAAKKRPVKKRAPSKPAAMTYKEFLKLRKKPTGSSYPGIRGPLDFGKHADMLENIAGFSVLADFMADEGMNDFVEEFPERFPDYALLAIIDYAACQKKDPDYAFDSYTEFFLCVDTSAKANPVMLWTGEGNFERLEKSFAEFYSSLVVE
jgi:hypothetical protein